MRVVATAQTRRPPRSPRTPRPDDHHRHDDQLNAPSDDHDDLLDPCDGNDRCRPAGFDRAWLLRGNGRRHRRRRDQAAIAAFQADAGIEADGEFGPVTDAAMYPQLQAERGVRHGGSGTARRSSTCTQGRSTATSEEGPRPPCESSRSTVTSKRPANSRSTRGCACSKRDRRSSTTPRFAREQTDPEKVRFDARPELINKVTWKIPNALVLVGSRSGDEWNGMTTSWVTQVAQEPVLIGIGVDTAAVTHRLIAEGGSFTVNLWNSENTRPFVKFSKPAKRGRLGTQRISASRKVPPVRRSSMMQCAWMECEVRQAVDCGTHTFFIGELVAAGVNDDEARPASMSDTRMKYGGTRARPLRSTCRDSPMVAQADRRGRSRCRGHRGQRPR